MTVWDVLDRYGISFRTIDTSQRMRCAGPRSCGLEWPSTVVSFHTAANTPVEEVLHEAMHLVCAAQPSDIGNDCEGEGLLQLERAIGVLMPPADYQAILDYQEATGVLDAGGRCHEVASFSRPTQTEWWLFGKRRAIRLGLLTRAGKPTWRRRTWNEEKP